MLLSYPFWKDIVSPAGVSLPKQPFFSDGAIEENNGLIVLDARDVAQLTISNRVLLFQKEESGIQAPRESLLGELCAGVS